MKATITKATGIWYDARLEDGAKVACRLKGKMRLDDKKLTNPVAVGDWVVLENDVETGTYQICEVLPRRNYLVRKDPHKEAFSHIIASNIDNALIIATMQSPRTSPGFIDRLLVVCESYHINPVIVFNKYDLYVKKDLVKLDDYVHAYKSAGYEVLICSTVSGLGMESLHERIAGKVNLLCGHSGVGKSSLMNTIYPGLDLRVGGLSGWSGKGMHTTTFAEWFDLPDGGAVIDTPGVKELGIADMESQDLGGYFPEFRLLMQACKYNNCLHMDEPGCAVLDYVEDPENKMYTRYASYLSMIDEILSGKKKWQKK